MKAKQQGWDDFFEAQDVNPFPAGDFKRAYWTKGWESAKAHWAPLSLSMRSNDPAHVPYVQRGDATYRHPIKDVN